MVGSDDHFRYQLKDDGDVVLPFVSRFSSTMPEHHVSEWRGEWLVETAVHDGSLGFGETVKVRGIDT